jgi:phosphorylcholine metabolism protein LicD
MIKIFCISFIILFIVLINLNQNKVKESFIFPNTCYELSPKLSKKDIVNLRKGQQIMTNTRYELSPKLSKKDIENLRKGQQIMTNIFREFDRICRKYNLKYWCVGGTFIGTIRHKGWIPHDGDIDVCMLKNDYEKFREVSKKELPKRMWLRDQYIDKTFRGYNHNFAKILDIYSYYEKYGKLGNDTNMGLQLDIFLYEQKNNKLICLGNCGHGGIVDMDYDIIFPLKELHFEDIKVYIPNKYKEYSKRYYKDYPPPLLPIEKRHPHEGKINPYNASQYMRNTYPELYKNK